MPRSFLISGIGIAGPALAWWLLRDGHSVTLIEHAPEVRTGGYVIDFWGRGYDITERMGLIDQVLRAGYQVQEVRYVNERGKKVGGFDADVFSSATDGRFTSLPRGDLGKILYDAIAGRVETLFDNTITALNDTSDGVTVEFNHGESRAFDCVIGADGLHSNVRHLGFGQQSKFERFLGYTVAAFDTHGYPHRDGNIYLSHAIPGAQLSRFSMRNDRTMFLFVVADKKAPTFAPHDIDAHKSYIRDRFKQMKWECPEILDAMDKSDTLYFDRVSQIRMESWSKGRVGLVGDAAHAPSLLAGQGSALALIDAYILAGEFKRSNSIEDAFANYEKRLKDFMLSKQTAAEKFAGSFAPTSSFGIRFRNFVTHLLGIPLVAKLSFGSTLLDKIDLPDY